MRALDPALGALLRYLGAVAAATATQLAILLGPGLVLALALHAVSRFVRTRALRSFGRAWYFTFGWLGTAAHEIGHLVFCLLFGHRVTRVKLFDPDPAAPDAGHVTHAFEAGNPWQRIGNFFIGVGPILLGAVVIFGASRLLLGPEAFAALRPAASDATRLDSLGALLPLARDAIGGAWGALAAIFTAEHLGAWRFWVFLYVTLSVGGGMDLSPSDLRGALGGFGVLAGLLILLNLCTLWLGGFFTSLLLGLAGAASVLWAVMFLALVLTLAAAAVVALLSGVVSLVRR